MVVERGKKIKKSTGCQSTQLPLFYRAARSPVLRQRRRPQLASRYLRTIDTLKKTHLHTPYKGLSFAPVKLQKLATLNALLAHQPWLINQSHLDVCARKMTKAINRRTELQALISGNDNDNWSVSELLQAVMILVLFHSLSGIAFGLGVVPEADREGGVQGRANESPLFSPTSPAEHAHEPTTPSKDLTNELLEKLNQIKVFFLFARRVFLTADFVGYSEEQQMSKLEEEPKGQGRELSVEEVQQRQKQFEDSEKSTGCTAARCSYLSVSLE